MAPTVKPLDPALSKCSGERRASDGEMTSVSKEVDISSSALSFNKDPCSQVWHGGPKWVGGAVFSLEALGEIAFPGLFWPLEANLACGQKLA